MSLSQTDNLEVSKLIHKLLTEQAEQLSIILDELYSIFKEAGLAEQGGGGKDMDDIKYLLNSLDNRLNLLDDRLNKIEDRIEKIENKIEKMPNEDRIRVIIQDHGATKEFVRGEIKDLENRILKAILYRVTIPIVIAILAKPIVEAISKIVMSFANK